MLLVDLMREKDYIEELIDRHKDYFMDVISFDIELYEKEKESLDNFYKQRQQLVVSIERAKHTTIIQLNDTKLSLSDAVVIKNNMRRKYAYYKSLLSSMIEKGQDFNKRAYVESLNDHVDQLSLDIKTLDDEINYALQNVEVSQ